MNVNFSIIAFVVKKGSKMKKFPSLFSFLIDGDEKIVLKKLFFDDLIFYDNIFSIFYFLLIISLFILYSVAFSHCEGDVGLEAGVMTPP